MVLIDSSVWIDFYRGRLTPQVIQLRSMLAEAGPTILMGDLILIEVLQGAPDERGVERIRRDFEAFQTITIAGPECAILAAQHYRTLRALGKTPRKTIDTLIATRCIMDNLALLYADKDFDPFVEHCGLIRVPY